MNKLLNQIYINKAMIFRHLKVILSGYKKNCCKRGIFKKTLIFLAENQNYKANSKIVLPRYL